MFKFNPLTGELDLVNGKEKTISVVISPGATTTVDSVLYSSMKSIEYSIVLHKSDFTKSKSMKMITTKVNSDLRDSVFAKTGNQVNCEVNSLVVGLNAELVVKNNEAFSVTCSFKRQTIN